MITNTEYAVKFDWGIFSETTRDDCIAWVDSYRNNPDALNEGESMPVVVMRTVSVSEWEIVV